MKDKPKGRRHFRSKRLASVVAAIVSLGAVACGGASHPSQAADSSGDPPEATSTSTATAAAAATPAATPDPRLTTPGELLRAGRFAEAATAYRALARGTSDQSTKELALLYAGVASFEAGDSDGAIAVLREAAATARAGSVVAQRATYLLGLRLNGAGSFLDAFVVLRPLATGAPAGSGDPLQPYIVAEYAKAAAHSGNGAAADLAWDSLASTGGVPTALRVSVLEERAALARTAGNTTLLANLLTQLVQLKTDPAVRYELAGIARTRGDGTAAAAVQLTAIILESPASKYATLAIADLHDAGVAVDRGQEGYVYYRRGAYAEARRVLSAAIEEPGISASTLAFRLYYLAAANEDAGLLSAAVPLYDRAAAAGEITSYSHRARYWAARTTEDLGDARGASNRYLDLATNGPAGEFTDEADFRAGYTLLRAGDAAGAIATWARISARSVPRLLYWKGRAYEATGDAAAAKAAYTQAVDAGPLDFHGLEAARRLGQGSPLDVSYRPISRPGQVDWDAIAAWLTPRAGARPPSSPPTAAAGLASIGLHERAEEVIFEATGGRGPWRLFELMEEAHEAGLPGTAASLAVQLREAVGVRSADVPKALLQMSYPLDYVSSLNEEARKNNIDPLFLAAVVRQESFWEPWAASSAGALGLTQVIPPTGEAIARALGVQGFKAADLFRPGLSLQFGAYYLGGQLQRFGSPLLALAAYNAGPANALRWAPAASGGSAADFVEGIDIPETQHYVESIIEWYAHYRKAYEP